MKKLKNILGLLLIVLILSGCSTKKVMVEMPELRNIQEEEAVNLLRQLKLNPHVLYKTDEEVIGGNVIKTSIESGKLIKENTDVTLFVSNNNSTIIAKSATIEWWDTVNSPGDEIKNISKPRIIGDKLVISFDAIYNTSEKVTIKNTGRAALNEEFNNSVSITCSTNGSPKAGSIVKVTVKIPIKQLSPVTQTVNTVWFAIDASVDSYYELLLYKVDIKWL